MQNCKNSTEPVAVENPRRSAAGDLHGRKRGIPMTAPGRKRIEWRASADDLMIGLVRPMSGAAPKALLSNGFYFRDEQGDTMVPP